VTTITVNAPDISCANCVAHIEKDMSALAGVSSVSADIASKDVTITFDETTLSRAQIAEAMDEAGYPITR
jgi:copper chaperone